MQKIAVVTGAASGIGKRIAQGLLEEGCIVFGLDIQYPVSVEEKLEVSYNEINKLHCDVSIESDVTNTIDTVINMCGAIDYLINVAGIISKNKCMTIEDLTMEEWDQVIKVNLTGTFMLCHYALLHLSKNGCIINFSTEQVQKPNVKSAPYAVSKAGIEMLTRILALDHTKRGVRANTVALGSVRTDFIRHMVESDAAFEQKMVNADKNMPFGIIEVEDVWLLVKYIIFDGKKLTGQTILLESGMTQL